MYEAHFRLHARPFGTKAVGPAVFTGPQQARTMRGLHLGLVAQDAVVTVAGPTGVGKTTIVGKALESIKPNRMAAWIGRMHLTPDELLDLLLAGFGAGKPVQGSIRRFALFRRIMAQRADAGTAVAVVVEDAKRLGVETLAELEALTAADTGDSAGANIILMGAPDLAAFLKDPALARLKQRIRRREIVAEFSQTEVSGYLRHCLRQAGGDYDRIFERGVDQIIYRASEGVARVINTLAENALQAAAEEGQQRITTGLMHEVASDNYTYEGPLPQFPAESEIDWEPPPRTETVERAGAQNDSLLPDERDLPPAARNIIVESGRYPELPEVAEAKPVAAASGQPPAQPAADRATASAAPGPEPATAADEFEIPELINDTQPELSALPMPKGDEAVKVETSQELPPRLAAGTPAAGDAEDGDDERFDLDAALAIDVESTNLMEGITPNLEKLAAAAETAGKSRAKPAAAPPGDDLPTLSNSMRVNVARTAKPAEQPVRKSPAPAPKSAPPPPVKPSPAVAPKTAATAKPEQAQIAADTRKPAAVPETAETPKPAARPTPAATPKPVSAPKAPAVLPVKPEPSPAAMQKRPAAAAPDDDDVPAVLEPEPELLAAMEDLPEPEPKAEQAKAAEPTQSEMTRRIAAIGTEKARHGVDALEAALESAKKRNQDELLATPSVVKPNGTGAPVARPAAPVPKLTLDNELTSTQKRKKEELKKAAAEISRAKSIEEFDDKMAETLFGDEDLEAIAAEVIANPPPGYEKPAKARDHESAPPPPSGPSPVMLDDSAGGAGLSLAGEPPAGPARPAGKDVAPATPGKPHATRAPGAHSADRRASPAPAAKPGPAKPPPDSIENQINISITQRMAALDLSRLGDGVADDPEDKPEKKSGGFFSRFRRSS